MFWKTATLLFVSAVAAARPVGEVDASAPDFGVPVANLEGLSETLISAQGVSLSRQIAALRPVSHVATFQMKPQQDGSIAALAEAANDGIVETLADSPAFTGERSPNINPSGRAEGSQSQASLPINIDQMEDLVAPVRRASQTDFDPLRDFRNSSGIAGNRSPAVLPQSDPTIPSFAGPSKSSFGDKEDLTFNKVAAGTTPEEAKAQQMITGEEGDDDDEANEQEREKDREEFNEALSDLAGRGKPYTLKDYVDYRDFVADQSGPLGQLDFSASGFQQKAKEIFNEFQNRDVNPESRGKKALFREFVTESEPAQRLIAPEPGSRAKSRTRTSH